MRFVLMRALDVNHQPDKIKYMFLCFVFVFIKEEKHDRNLMPKKIKQEKI